MKSSSYKEFGKDEELERLKGTCYNLQDKVCEVMRDVIREIDDKKQKNKRKKQPVVNTSGDSGDERS